MAKYSSIDDVPGLHFTTKDGYESNVKLSGSVDANPDIASVVNGQFQTVYADEMGFLWRTKSENFNIVRSARVIGLDLNAKLDSLTKKLTKYTGLSKKTRAIYVVKHGDKFLDEMGRDVAMADVQKALWLKGDGIASLSHAKVALKKLLNIDSKSWTGHVYENRNLELARIFLDDDLEILSE